MDKDRCPLPRTHGSAILRVAQEEWRRPIKEPTILYIAGWGRSGSTLLCKMLGEIDGWIPVGEARLIWQRCVVGDSVCACGKPFSKCGFWQAVFEQAFGGMDHGHARHMIDLADRLHTWHLLVMPTSALDRRAHRHMGEYIRALRSLYAAISEVSGADVVVDSSKHPGYGYALESAFADKLRIAHLTRDPRAAAYSWTKRRKEQSWGRMRHIGPASNALQWVIRNEAVRSVWSGTERYHQVRYEELVADPESSLKAVAASVGENDLSSLPVDGNEFRFDKTHIAVGNPSRSAVGRTIIRNDDAWKSALPARDEKLVRWLTWPWLRQYGRRASYPD